MVISTKLALEQIFVHCFVVRHMRLGWLLWLVFRVPSSPALTLTPGLLLASPRPLDWPPTSTELSKSTGFLLTIFWFIHILVTFWKCENLKKNDLAFFILYYLLMVWHLKFYLIYIICSISYMFIFFVVLTDEWWLIANLCRDEVFPKLDAKANI